MRYQPAEGRRGGGALSTVTIDLRPGQVWCQGLPPPLRRRRLRTPQSELELRSGARLRRPPPSSCENDASPPTSLRRCRRRLLLCRPSAPRPGGTMYTVSTSGEGCREGSDSRPGPGRRHRAAGFVAPRRAATGLRKSISRADLSRAAPRRADRPRAEGRAEPA